MSEIEIFEDATKSVDEKNVDAIKDFLESHGAEQELLNSFAEIIKSKNLNQVGIPESETTEDNLMSNDVSDFSKSKAYDNLS